MEINKRHSNALSSIFVYAQLIGKYADILRCEWVYSERSRMQSLVESVDKVSERVSALFHKVSKKTTEERRQLIINEMTSNNIEAIDMLQVVAWQLNLDDLIKLTDYAAELFSNASPNDAGEPNTETAN